jgi:hypothetical protein
MSDRARLTKLTGDVWCDYEGGLHRDTPDPYNYGPDGYTDPITYKLLDHCPGPHRHVYVYAKPSEGQM